MAKKEIHKILITGGLGFIGKHLIRILLKENPELLIVVDNLSNSSESDVNEFRGYPNFQFIHHDISLPIPAMEQNIDVVFNLAALVSVPDSFLNPLRTHQVNETGFINVLEFCKAHKVSKLVYASSCAVYGSSPNIPLKESEKVIPESPYGLTKLNNEHYARFFHQACGLESVGLRFFNVFGPGQKPDSPYAGVISIFMDRAMKGQDITIYGDGSQSRDFVYVGDVVRALVAASESDVKLGAYNVGTNTPTSVNELFTAIARIAGYEKNPTYAPARMGDVEASLADVNKTQQDLNFMASCSLESGLIELYKALKAAKK